MATTTMTKSVNNPISVRFRADQRARLEELAELEGENPSTFIKKAVLEYMEDLDDYIDGMVAYRDHLKHPDDVLTVDEMAKSLGIEL